MFRGTAFPKLDDKYRLAVPAKYRDKLAHDIVVVCEIERCLGLYRLADFEAKMAEASDAPATFRTVRDYQRWMMSRAEDVTPDGQGRVTLTSTQRTWAGLERDVVVIGAGNHLEVWNPDTWTDYSAGLDNRFQDYDGRIGPDTTA
jgi:MraZ protein